MSDKKEEQKKLSTEDLKGLKGGGLFNKEVVKYESNSDNGDHHTRVKVKKAKNASVAGAKN